MTEGRLLGQKVSLGEGRVISIVKAFKNRDCDVEGRQKSILPQLVVKIILRE